MKPNYLAFRCLVAFLPLVAGMAYADGNISRADNSTAPIATQYAKLLADSHTVIEGRVAFEKMMKQWPLPKGVTIRTVDANGVSGKWFSPDKVTTKKRGVILYLHGGGFRRGSSDSHRVLAATLAKEADADVLLIDYRLLPEATYPAQIDDVLASYEWLLKQGYQASRVAVAGESAGGNLVLELALHLRDANRSLPSSLVAMSPITDLTASGNSMQTNAANDPLLKRGGILDVTRAYMNGGDPKSHQASPLFADLHGLPPLLLQVASGEILLDDSLRIAEVAAKDNVPVSLTVWPGMIHQWQLFPTAIPDALRAIRDSGQFIRTNMTRSEQTQ